MPWIKLVPARHGDTAISETYNRRRILKILNKTKKDRISMHTLKMTTVLGLG